jgi:hypothetical protein
MPAVRWLHEKSLLHKRRYEGVFLRVYNEGIHTRMAVTARALTVRIKLCTPYEISYGMGLIPSEKDAVGVVKITDLTALAPHANDAKEFSRAVRFPTRKRQTNSPG